MHPELWFSNLPPELATMLLAMLPITELRASIPIGILYYHLSPWSALIWSFIGDVIPMILLVNLLGPVSKWLSGKSKTMHKFFDWLFSRTRNRFAKKYEVYGALALIVFVAIPLPVTGAWTGSVAAFLYGIKPNKSILYIAIGALISGIIVTLLTVSGKHLFG